MNTRKIMNTLKKSLNATSLEGMKEILQKNGQLGEFFYLLCKYGTFALDENMKTKIDDGKEKFDCKMFNKNHLLVATGERLNWLFVWDRKFVFMGIKLGSFKEHSQKAIDFLVEQKTIKRKE